MTAKSIFDRRKAFGAVICGVLCLLMLVGLAFLTETDAHAATVTASGTCGDNLTWSLDSEGALTISGSGAMASWSSYSSVPWYSQRSSIKTVVIGDSVTSIGNNAFYYCSSLTSITIPDSVTSIRYDAFSGCSSLTSVTIPDSVTSIRDNAFCECSSLTSVTIGNSVTHIGSCAFEDCSSLASITIPNSVTSIGADAFFYCRSLTSITIGNGVTSIGSNAFYGCSKLTSITIPNSVTSIGDYAFEDCSENLESIIVAEGNSKYHSSGNCLIETESKTLILGCKNSIIPSDGSVTSIGTYAFNGCISLTSITIPNSVTSIGEYAFLDCSVNLESITVAEGNSKYHSTGNCLIETESKTLILGCKNSIIPSDGSVTSIGERAFYECSGLTSINIPNSVTSIGSSAFEDCSSLKSVTIPDGVTSIGKSAFYNCSSLTNVTIPNSVTSIGSSAFEDCSSLKSVTIPDGVTSIGKSAFYNCSSLTNVTIPNSVTSIGSSAFEDCSGLTNVTIPNSVTSIGSGAFRYCSGLTSITIPNSVTNIGNYAFYGCSKLTSVTIPNSVTNIGNYAFYGCSKLTSITIPDSVTSIGKWAFRGCTGLTEIKFNAVAMNDLSSSNYVFYNAGKNGDGIKVTIGKDVTKIPAHLFYPCSSSSSSPKITSVEFEEGSVCKSIGNYAFYNCSSLTDIAIPASVDTIGRFAFRRSGLESVTFGGNNAWSIGDEGVFSFADALNALVNRYYDKAWTSAAAADAVSVVAVGKCGKDVDWLLSDDGVLTVTGSGAMYDFGAKSAPWAGYKAQIKSVVIGEGVTSIGKCAFYECANITSVSLPSTLTGIGNYAFYGCKALTEITVPASVNTIGAYAFRKCNSLTTATFENANGWNYGDANAEISAEAIKANYKNAWTRA